MNRTSLPPEPLPPSTFRHRSAHLRIYVGKKCLKLLFESKSNYLRLFFPESLEKGLKSA